MRKIFVILVTFIFLNFNTYAETLIKHESNTDGSDTFDINFIFQSVHNVKKNFQLLTDFENIHKFNPSAFKTEILSKDVDKLFLKTTFRDCVLFFCREMKMYEYIFSYCENNNFCIIQSEVIPKNDSPVISGKTTWKIKNHSKTNKSMISYQSKFRAFLTLPPFIGDSIFKKTIQRNLKFLEEKINGLP